MVLVLQSGRPKPASAPPSDPEKIALFESMLAYSGTYVVQEDRVIHDIDAGWIELWTGTPQIRLLGFENGNLVYTTPETTDPMDGRQSTYRVVFERAGAG